MGHFIDRAALRVISAGTAYLFFMGAFGSIPIAAAAAFISLALIKKLTSRIPSGYIGRRRRRLARARSEVEALSLGDTEASAARIHNILSATYSGQLDGAAVYPILRHPSGRKLSADDIADAWRALHEYERAVIVSTAQADTGAAEIANRLHSPRLSLIDGVQLAGIIAALSTYEYTAPVQKQKKRPLASAMLRSAGRAKAGKCIFTAGMMFLLFWISGSGVYLLGSLLMTSIAALSLRRRRLPRELFAK